MQSLSMRRMARWWPLTPVLTGAMALVLVVGSTPAGAATPSGSRISGAAVSATPPGSITVTPSTGLLNGQELTIALSGFQNASSPLALECSTATGQPTVEIAGFAAGVSCTSPYSSFPGQGFAPPNTSSPIYVVVHTGVIGPPELGFDSGGRNAAADAASYPCPPTAAQASAGAVCEITVADPTGNTVSRPISFGTPILAHPAVAASPASGLSQGNSVTVTGTGFTPGSPGSVTECNITPGEPAGNSQFPNLGIACVPPTFGYFPPTPTAPPTSQSTAPSSGPALPYPGPYPGPPPQPPGSFPGTFVTTASGAFQSSFTVVEGNIGQTTASAAYPCPPSPANLAAGGSCVAIVGDAAGEQAQVPLGITGPPPTPSVTVAPSTNLVNGSQVGVVGTGFVPNSSGAVLECSTAPGQPTIAISGVPAPVSCSNPFNPPSTLISPSPAGSVTAEFTIRTGTVGPPATGTDSNGTDATSDAAKFPCPPTPSQLAAGSTCEIVVGDLAGDAAGAPISFSSALNTAPPGALSHAVVAIAATPDGGGYWLAQANGGIFPYGDAGFFGSGAGSRLNAPIVGMAATPDGKGYWLAAADGGVFSYGDAGFYGSAGNLSLQAPVVGIGASRDGRGYWLAGADGGVFSYGDAAFDGAMAGTRLNRPVVGIVVTPDGLGYWLAGGDGGVFTFGDASYFPRPVTGQFSTIVSAIAPHPSGPNATGGGYWLVSPTGAVSAENAPFYGELSPK